MGIKPIVLLAIVSLLLPGSVLLFPGQASAVTYERTIFTPPYNDAATWENELALGWAWTAANEATGFISASAFSYAGGASAEARQRVWVDAPSGQVSEVTVSASIIYAGGCEKIGLGCSAWGGVDKVWYIGSDYHKSTLDAVFGYDDIGWAAFDLATIMVPGLVEAGYIKEGATIAQVVNFLDEINDATELAQTFYALSIAGKAQRTQISFSFETTGPTYVAVGLRTDTSGALLGACDSTVLGCVESISVGVTSYENRGKWSFNSWGGGGADIYDDSYNNHTGTPHNGPISTGGKVGDGIKFDGEDDWVSFIFYEIEREKLAHEGTFMLWVKPEEVRDGIIIYGGSGSSASGNGPDKELHLSTDGSGHFVFYLGSYAANERDSIMGFGSYEPDQWNHIAVTYSNFSYEAIQLKAYVNGNFAGSWTNYVTGRAELVLDDLRLGRPNADEHYFKGAMDEVRVYSWELTDSEIKTICWQGIDYTPPSIPVMIAEPQFSPGDSNMVACEPSTDAESGVMAYQFRYRLRGASWEESSWIGSTSYIFDSLADGALYDYAARAKDGLEITSGWSSSVSSQQDASPPGAPSLYLGAFLSGTIQGDKFLIDGNLSANDYPAGSASGIAKCQFSYDGESWQTYSLPEPYHSHFDAGVQIEIPLIQGSYTIWSKVIDGVGNESTALCTISTFDWEPPSGTIEINGGAEFTANREVTLTLSASDNLSGLCSMRFKNYGEAWSMWESFSSTRNSWLLCPEGEEYHGGKMVYVEFMDCAGNIFPAYPDFIYYGTAPSGEILIDDNAPWGLGVVTLSLNATAAVLMTIWNEDEDPGCHGWLPYCTSWDEWTLSAGDGEKTVYVKFKGTGGEESPTYSDNINKDATRPTGSILINNGDFCTCSPAVTLTLSASDNYSGIAGMRLHNEGEAWTLQEPYQETRSWQLPPCKGIKRVEVRFGDRAGRQSYTAHDVIFMDLCPPAGAVEINHGDDFTQSNDVSLYAEIVGEGYSMPEQFSSTQGEKGWYYYRSTAPGDYTELCWDNYVSPWGLEDHYSWNAQVGEDDPRFLRILSLEETAAIQTGEHSNVAIGWKSDRASTLNIKGELWAASADGGSPGGNDDGVYFSIYKNGTQVAGPVHVFHNADLRHGTLEVPGCSVQDGDMIYFYLDRGTWQDCDAMYYSFSIIRGEELPPCYVRFANLMPEDLDPLILSQIRDGSGLLWYKALKDVTWTDWQDCSPGKQLGWQLSPGDGYKTIIAEFKDWPGNISRPQKANIILQHTVISGITYEVNCDILPGTAVELFDSGGIPCDSTTSDGSGEYTLTTPESGTYTVTASKAGFGAETQMVVAGTSTVTLDFCDDNGLIPNEPETSYLVSCIHCWLHPELGCELGTPRLVSVIHAWLHPVSEE